MSFFEDRKIATKIMMLLGLLGLFILATVVFTASRMQRIDDLYSALLTKDAKGVVLVGRLNTRLLDTGRLMYMMIAESDQEKMRTIDREITATTEKFREFAGGAKILLPRRAAEIDEMAKTFDALVKAMQDVRERALANDNDAANLMMSERFIPVLTTLRTSVNSLVEGTLGNLEQVSSEATAQTTSTIRATYLFVCTGLALVLLLANFASRRYLSKPIVAMGEVMGRLADRDYTVEIHGASRRDEVGVMAKAVQVFKEGMMRADEAAAQQERDRQEREQRARKIEAMTREFDGAVSAI
ncbi:HAMP domain-containing protein, partial [Telmatospirillum siberiense]